MVAVAVLFLLVVMISQVVGGASKAILGQYKVLDADGQARLIFSQMAGDLAGMLARNDVDVLFLKQPGNDKIFFYSQASGAYDGSLYPASNDPKNAVSLVGYRIAPNGQNPNMLQLERLGKGLTWDASTAASSGSVRFLTYVSGSSSPLAASTMDQEWPVTSGTFTGTDPDFHILGDQVFRFEYFFLLTDTNYSVVPVIAATGVANNLTATSAPTSSSDSAAGYSPGSRWFDQTGGRGYICLNSAVGAAVWRPAGVQDVTAIVVAIGILDRNSRKLVTGTTGLVGLFTDPVGDSTDLQMLPKPKSLTVERIWKDAHAETGFSQQRKLGRGSRGGGRADSRLPTVLLPPSSLMKNSSPGSRSRMRAARGSALIIVLAMVVLLTALMLAFLSRASLQHRISATSSSRVKVDQFALGAIAVIQSDLRQEIVDPLNSGTVTTLQNKTIYRPLNALNVVPAIAVPSGTGTYTPAGIVGTGLENLVKESKFGMGFYPGGAARAANVSTASSSANGRQITAADWNLPLLIQKANPASTDYTPAGAFMAPDWILVARDGSNPTSWNVNMRAGATSSTVLGRYAYTIYNEGGLLDMNSAGCPSSMIAGQANAALGANKSALAFADLTQVGLTPAQIDTIVGWRNYASAQQPLGAFPNYTLTSANATNYFQSIVGNTTRFIMVSGTSTPNNQSDGTFSSRQQLIKFLTQGVASGSADEAQLQNALLYLGNYSRVLNQPSYWPDPDRPKVASGNLISGMDVNYQGGNSAFGKDDLFNPNYRSVDVTAGFVRADGSVVANNTFEPLVKKRFALSRLCWLTHKGPSADLYSSNPSDPIIQQLIADGISISLIQEGTAANIYKYFGLTWGPVPKDIGGYWIYNHGVAAARTNGVVNSGTLTPARIGNLSELASPPYSREPDFFELLQSAVCVGAVAKGQNGPQFGIVGTATDISQCNGAREQLVIGSAVDDYIIQLGANIIDQAQPDNFPTQIVYDDIARTRSFWGKVDYPYWYAEVETGILTAVANPPPPVDGMPDTATLIDSGTLVAISVPVIWNPVAQSSHWYDSNNAGAPTRFRIWGSALSSLGAAVPSSAGGPHLANAPGGYFNYTTKFRYMNSGTALIDGVTLNAPWTGTDSPTSQYGDYDASTGILSSKSGQPAVGLDFNYDPALYREPMPLLRYDSGSPAGVKFDSTKIPSEYATGITEAGSNMKYAGLYIGRNASRVTLGSPSQTYTMSNIQWQTTGFHGPTVTLEYQHNGNWYPYQQVVLPLDGYGGLNGWVPYGTQQTANASEYPLASAQGWNSSPPNWSIMAFDPRTMMWAPSATGDLGSFIDGSFTILSSLRPDSGFGRQAKDHYPGGTSMDMWDNRGYAGGTVIYQTGPDNGKDGYWYDPDYTLRRGMAAYVPGAGTTHVGTTSVGMPMATVYNNPANGSSRSIMLHRPFRSVGELSYVFAEVPWRDIDFFTPESGYSALLDVFCINEDNRTDALAAGKVDLNGRQWPVFAAILGGACRDELNATTTGLTSDEAKNIAQKLIARTTSTATGMGPLSNLSELVGHYNSSFNNPGAVTSGTWTNASHYDGFSRDLPGLYATTGSTVPLQNNAGNYVKRFIESTVRALSDTGQAGTWNLMIDVVAQTGRYGATASALDQFIVEGQQRYWVHLAIDRETGQVIDQTVEPVNE